MGIYVLEMFNTQGEDVADADLNKESGGTSGDFVPPFDGRLLKVILMWSGEAVTSLAEYVRVTLTANNWAPNSLKFGMTMNGIRTAPTTPVLPFEYVVDQPIKTTQAIKGQFAYDNAVTPVTCDLHVYGVFSGP